MAYQNPYDSLPVPGAPAGMPLVGDKTTANSGVVTPPASPAVNSAPPGAPSIPKLPDIAIQHGAVQPTAPNSPPPATPAAAPPALAQAQNAPSGPPPPPLGSDVEARINSYLTNIMSGNGTPFSPEVMGKLRGRLFGAANGQADTAISQAKDDAVKRGMFRSGLPTDAILAARAAAGQNYTKGEADLESQAAQANQGAEMNATQALISQLANSRDYAAKEQQIAQSAPRGPDYNLELLQMLGGGGMAPPEFG